MIVYVETNFILEIVFEQEQVGAAEELLSLTEQGVIEIHFPAFSLIEPYWTIIHRGKERKSLCSALSQHRQQLQRSSRHQEIARSLEPVTTSMLNIEKMEREVLKTTARRLNNVGVSIEMDGDTFIQSLEYHEKYGLEPHDALIYASLIEDLKQRSSDVKKCFISKNSKDFFDQDIEAELASYNCTYIASFEKCLQFAKRYSR